MGGFDPFAGLDAPCDDAVTGTQDDGAECDTNDICKSRYCKKGKEGCSGKCAAKGADGADCGGNEACAKGLLCLKSTCQAQPAGNEGDLCSSKAPLEGQWSVRKALRAFRKDLLADSEWHESTDAIIDDIKDTVAGSRKELGCDTATPHSACRVGVRFMVYISRSGSGPKVFAQMVAAFEAAILEPRLVALNLVGAHELGQSVLGGR